MVGAKLDEDIDDQKGERNQRAIALYGIGARRKKAKKDRKNLILNLFKSMLEPNDEGSFTPSSDAVFIGRTHFCTTNLGIL